jgi:hypothetical protein
LIDTLITYLPLSRISDVPKYFEKNYSVLRPRRAIIYVDNVENDQGSKTSQMTRKVIEDHVKSIFELKTGNWMDRNLCLMQLFNDLRSDNNYENAYIVDSDNLLDDSFQSIDDEMEKSNFSFYTVMDKTIRNDENFMKRSELVLSKNELQVWRYRIFRRGWRSPFFIGPKQGIRLNRKFADSLNGKTIVAITKSMTEIEPSLRNYLHDEQSLGMLLYYSGLRYTHWIRQGSHVQGPRSERPNYLLHALVHSYFGKKMIKYNGGLGIRWYYLRNKLALTVRSLVL